jgi:hypothetical protein
MVWPPGFTAAPKEERLNYDDCPFPEEHRQDFAEGEDIIKYVGYSLLGWSLLISGVVWRKWRHLNRVKKLVSKVEESFADKVVFYAQVIETLQYIGYGPHIDEGEKVLSQATDFASGGQWN